MAKKTREPDRLAQDAAAALAAGMTYGKWKAMQEPVKKVPVQIPEGWKACAYCGKPFKTKQGKKFCEIGCRNDAYAEKNKQLKAEYMKGYRERKTAEAAV